MGITKHKTTKMITSMKYILAIVLAFLMTDVGTSVPLRTNNIQSTKKLSNFNVKVSSAPSRDYERAIEHCASILESHWVSNTTTVVNVDFNSFNSTGNLANARPTALHQVGTYRYPIALAKSIPGIDIRSNRDSDIEVKISPKEKWYTGIDGRTPSNQSDLVSICIHEIIHGLFFYGSRETIFENRFDAFLTTKTEDGEYCSLRSFEHEPQKLKTALTNNELSFSENNRIIAKLSAPKKFKRGASIYHLDYDTYKSGPEAVMIPSDVLGESRHSIGPVLKEIQNTLRDQSAIPPKRCMVGANPVKETKKNDRSNVKVIVSSSIGGTLLLVSLIICAWCCWGGN